MVKLLGECTAATALLVVALIADSTRGVFSRSSPFFLQTAPRWFSGSQHAQTLNILNARGGAAAVEEEESDEPVELYLPGLLDTSISRPSKVRK
jgi:hypothetical protein